MNNKITIYELLGLVKDGQAPKRIKVTGNVYEYDDEFDMYMCDKKTYRVALGGMKNKINLICNAFNEIVEILDNEDEDIEIPKKLKAILEFNKNGNHISKTPSNEELMFKINEIIDYLKSKGE